LQMPRTSLHGRALDPRGCRALMSVSALLAMLSLPQRSQSFLAPSHAAFVPHLHLQSRAQRPRDLRPDFCSRAIYFLYFYFSFFFINPRELRPAFCSRAIYFLHEVGAFVCEGGNKSRKRKRKRVTSRQGAYIYRARERETERKRS